MLLSGVLLLSGCSGISLQRPPAFQLDIAPAFAHSTATKRFNKGDFLWNSPPYVKKADFATTKISGSWGPRTDIQSTDHSWSIEVSSAPTAKVLDAYNRAKNGYDANVDETGSYMFARFEKKTFVWGRAFSYLTQFTQDSSLYVPHNGHLTYEVWGVTNDLRHVVHATFSVTHRRLASWGPDVRDARTIEALKNDRDYRLVESCSAAAFEPSLTEIDSLVDSLRLQ